MDNGTREGLDKFLKAASTDPETVLHYEFMQDYKVWLLQFVSYVLGFSISMLELAAVLCGSELQTPKFHFLLSTSLFCSSIGSFEAFRWSY